jgi:hypothetical protein
MGCHPLPPRWRRSRPQVEVAEDAREWELIGFKEGEAVDDFALRLSGLMSSLAIYGEPVDEQRAVEKLLRVVPSKYSQIALSIETLLDTATLSVEEVTGRLKTVDERSDAAFALE